MLFAVVYRHIEIPINETTLCVLPNSIGQPTVLKVMKKKKRRRINKSTT